MKTIYDFEPLWGTWKVDGFLGAGSFGKVYKVRREELGTTYRAAVKHISIPADENELNNLYEEGLATDEPTATSYYRDVAMGLVKEVSTMCSLKGYTNIVCYEDHILIPKENIPGFDIFIRMELLTSLAEWLKTHECSRDIVVRMATDICDGLSVLEKYNMVHRDIKPQNVFVNEIGVFKIGDFGEARKLENLSTVMSKKGTYTFMAPEIYLGTQSDNRADIYSLGIMMYRMLNGNRVPFLPATGAVSVAQNEEALQTRMRGNVPMPAPAYADPALAAVILKACAYRKEDRYRTAAEMKAALEIAANAASFTVNGGAQSDTNDSTVSGGNRAPAPQPVRQEPDYSGADDATVGRPTGYRAPVSENAQPSADNAYKAAEDATVGVFKKAESEQKKPVDSDATVSVFGNKAQKEPEPVKPAPVKKPVNNTNNGPLFRDHDTPPVTAPEKKSRAGLIIAVAVLAVVIIAFVIVSMGTDNTSSTKKTTPTVSKAVTPATTKPVTATPKPVTATPKPVTATPAPITVRANSDFTIDNLKFKIIEHTLNKTRTFVDSKDTWVWTAGDGCKKLYIRIFITNNTGRTISNADLPKAKLMINSAYTKDLATMGIDNDGKNSWNDYFSGSAQLASGQLHKIYYCADINEQYLKAGNKIEVIFVDKSGRNTYKYTVQ